MATSFPAVYLNKLKELFAFKSHTHSEYAASNHTHSDYASSSHTHTKSQITDLPSLPTAVIGVPDYSTKRALPVTTNGNTSTATVPEDGYVNFAIRGQDHNATINGVTVVWSEENDGYSDTCQLLPVKAGDVVTAYTLYHPPTIYFYKMR